MMLAAVLLSLLAAWLTWWMLRGQLTPMFDAMHLLSSMSNGSTAPRVLPITNHDEIGSLIGGFNRLIEALTHREEKIQGLSNMYSALSQCNQAIVRCTNEDELFSQICGDIVRFGGMKMAWIGMLDAGSKRVKPVASFGDGVAYLEGIEISVNADEPAGRGPTGTSMRENRLFICQDFQHDPATSAWHESGARFGWGSSAAAPLLRAGVVVGALSIYDGKINAFNDALQALLTEMAADISFALDNFDREAKRKLAEAALVERDEMLRESQVIASMGSYVLDIHTGRWESSDALDQLFGIDETYVRSIEGWLNLIHPDDRMMMGSYLKNEVIGRRKPFNREYRIIRSNDRAERWVHGLGRLTLDAQGEPLTMKGTIQDITDRKLAEGSLNKLSQAVAQSPNSIVITDREANIEYANAAFTKITGYSLDEVIGKNPRVLQSGKTPKATYDDMWAHLTSGDKWEGELHNLRKDGSEYVELTKISPVREANGQITHYLAIKEDLTDKKAVEEHINKLAHFDQLTGLPNRTQLKDRFNFALSLAQRRGENLAVLHLDLDHFKIVNDTLGQSVGDELLMEVGKRIKACVRDEDTVSRQGGDEFTLLLPGTDANGAAIVASKLIEAIQRPARLLQQELIATASIGIAIYPYDGGNLDTLSKNADAAMYRVKQATHNNFRFFTPEMQAQSTRTLELSLALHHALARDEFLLHYQPQISVDDGRVVGAEALLRWRHPELGMISPGEFIPIAEASGMIIPIGEWVLRNATAQLKAWMDSGMPPMVVAVNFSAVQFHQPNIVDVIARITDEAKLPCKYLEVELTEAVAMHDPLSAIAVMDRLYELGIRMSIDDFGTGYSSLSYLKKFKVCKLKIDQSFVRDLGEDPEDKAIVNAIINLSSSLGLRSIAEGVETASQLAHLRLQGCDEVQGYYFSKPLPAGQFEKFVNDSMAAPSAV